MSWSLPITINRLEEEIKNATSFSELSITGPALINGNTTVGSNLLVSGDSILNNATLNNLTSLSTLNIPRYSTGNLPDVNTLALGSMVYDTSVDKYYGVSRQLKYVPIVIGMNNFCIKTAYTSRNINLGTYPSVNSFVSELQSALIGIMDVQFSMTAYKFRFKSITGNNENLIFTNVFDPFPNNGLAGILGFPEDSILNVIGKEFNNAPYATNSFQLGNIYDEFTTSSLPPSNYWQPASGQNIINGNAGKVLINITNVSGNASLQTDSLNIQNLVTDGYVKCKSGDITCQSMILSSEITGLSSIYASTTELNNLSSATAFKSDITGLSSIYGTVTVVNTLSSSSSFNISGLASIYANITSMNNLSSNSVFKDDITVLSSIYFKQSGGNITGQVTIGSLLTINKIDSSNEGGQVDLMMSDGLGKWSIDCNGATASQDFRVIRQNNGGLADDFLKIKNDGKFLINQSIVNGDILNIRAPQTSNLTGNSCYGGIHISPITPSSEFRYNGISFSGADSFGFYYGTKAGIFCQTSYLGSRLYFMTSNNFANGITSRGLAIDQDGNILIKKDFGAVGLYALDVNGDVNVSGNYRINGNVVNSGYQYYKRCIVARNTTTYSYCTLDSNSGISSVFQYSTGMYLILMDSVPGIRPIVKVSPLSDSGAPNNINVMMIRDINTTISYWNSDTTNGGYYIRINSYTTGGVLESVGFTLEISY